MSIQTIAGETMNMSAYTFTVKLTPRGKHYVIVTIGKDVIYVSRKVYSSVEEAMVEARTYLENQSTSYEQKTSRQ